MMPLSSHSGGGRSSSSSNLSPLAPPFTLDKSYHKQQNSNSPVNFTAQPYGHRFEHPSPVWNPSINSPFGPNFTENSSKGGNFAPSDVLGFPGSQPKNSSATSQLGSLNSEVTSGYDGFPYGQYRHSVTTSVVEAKPYYPPHVANDRNLLAHNEPSYDLLSNFGVDQLSGSSQVDGTRKGSGVEYAPQWNGLWNGLNDMEQGNWLGLGGNVGSKNYKPSDSSIGKKYMKTGLDAGVNHYDYHAGTLPIGGLGSNVDTSIKSTNCFDGFGGENNFRSTSIGNSKSFKGPNPGATTVSCIRESTMGSSSACSENLNLQDPFLRAPLPKHSGLYEHPVDSRDKLANYTESYVFNSTSTMKSSPTNMTQMAFGGFPSPQDARPSTTGNFVSNEATDKIERSSDFLSCHPFNLNCQVSNYTGVTDSIFSRSSSAKMEDNLNKKAGNEDCFNQMLTTKSLSPIPHLSAADCLKMKSDTADTFYSMEKSLDGPDIQNPAEDSPCWKGAPAAHFSPFGDSEVVIPDVFLEKLEARVNFKSEEPKNNPIRLIIADNLHATSDMHENTSAKRSFDANYVSKECDGSRIMKHRFPSAKLYGQDGFQSLDKKQGLDFGAGNDFSLLNYSEDASSSESSQSLQINSEDHKVVPEEKLESAVAATVANAKGKFPDPPSSDGLSCSPTSAGDHLLHSPSENVATSKDDLLSGKNSNPTVDINVLVNAMKNLSEVLMAYCSSNHTRSTELDHAALKQIIGNLNSCLVKEASQVTQTEKAQDSQPSQVVRKATTAHDHPGLDILEDLKCDNFCSRNEDDFDSYFPKDNAETVKDADTIKAIKRVLDMNCPKEEMQPETVLYKNLWLEAEAALCAATVRSRVHQMKIEMEKRNHRHTNDKKIIPISKVCDENKVSEALDEANGSPSSSKDAEGHHTPTIACPSVNSQSHANDDEASVMDRFQILKSLADNSVSMNAGDGKSPNKEKFVPPSPDHSIQDSYFSSIASHKDDPEASVMSRLNILKSRIEQLESLGMDAHPVSAEVHEPASWSFFSTVNRSSGLQPAGENVKDCLGASMSSNPGNNPCKVDGLRNEPFEGWYDCAESGWEHVIKEGCPKQN